MYYLPFYCILGSHVECAKYYLLNKLLKAILVETTDFPSSYQHLFLQLNLSTFYNILGKNYE